jgi:hypothetical protein
MLRPASAARDAEPVEQLLDVGGELAHSHATGGDRAAPEAPQIGCRHAEAVAQRGDLRIPQRPVERVAVDQHHAVATAHVVVVVVVVVCECHAASLAAGR